MRTHDTNAHDHAHINVPSITWSPQSAFVDPRDEEEERRKVSCDVKVPTFGDLLVAKQQQELSAVAMTRPPDAHSIRKPLTTDDDTKRRAASNPQLASMTLRQAPSTTDPVLVLKECMQHLQRQQSLIESCIARERALTDTIISHMSSRQQTRPTGTVKKRRSARHREQVHHSLRPGSKKRFSYTTAQSSWATTWSLIASMLLFAVAVVILVVLCASLKSQKTCIARLLELNAVRNLGVLP